jgi:iron complex outermembrane recepter protein
MKLFFFSISLLCFFQKVTGQVSGKLITADSLPIPFVSVGVIKSTDSSFVKAAFTNENGVYQMNDIPAGKYMLQVSSIGYSVWYSPVFELTGTQNKKDFGVQVMIKESKQLEEIVVRADKPLFQQKPEGIVVNVENSLLAKGSSALQVLERSPGVVINHRDNSIALNGKNGVMVMLNGKLMRLPMEQVVNLLNGMSADDISTIELLSTPPAAYDAEGSAGLINIVLKKNKKQGTNGTLSLTTGYSKGEKATASINLSHNTRYMNVYGSYTFSHNRSYSDMFLTSSQHMAFLGGDAFVNYWDTTKVVINNHDASIGLDAKLNAKTTVGGSITYNKSGRSGGTVTNAGYNVLPDSLIQFNGDNHGTSYWNNILNSVYIEKTIRGGEKINFNIDYLYFNNNGNAEVQSSFINKHGIQAGTNEILFSPRQKGFANTTIKVGVTKMDYAKQLSKKIKLETGIKAAYTQSTSLSGIQSLLNGVWTGSDQTSNFILMKEGLAAGYVSVSSQINESTSLVIGARYEYSYTNMDNSKTGINFINRKIGSLFPSIFFSEKINDNAEMQLSYTKRISRPSYNDLASYVGYSDPTAVYTGNPFLQPTITNNIKLGYNYKGYSFSFQQG